MSEEQSFLEQLPQAAVEVRDGKITALNSAALSHLPELAVGDQPPQYLAAPLDSAQTAGAFTGGGACSSFPRSLPPEGCCSCSAPPLTPPSPPSRWTALPASSASRWGGC